MKNIFINIIFCLLVMVATVLGLYACDYEAEQNEIKNRQWSQDFKDNKPYTNYGE